LTTPPRRPSEAARGTRRSRRPAPRSATFLERNRNRLLATGGVLVFAILAGLAFLNATQPAYACGALFDPTPAPAWVPPTAAPVASGATPAPTATAPPVGYVEPDMGHLHVDPGTRVKYTNCPPASGKHYNATGQGPIAAGVYGPDDVTIPQNWVHNMEHGGLVLLYKCPGPACDDAGQQALRDLYEQWPNSPVCDAPRGSLGNLPVFTRFDEMAAPYTALVWDVVLPMQTLDTDLILRFFAERGEQYNPEKFCAAPTPTAAPTATPGPTATPAPTPAPTATAPASTGSAAPTAAAS
jgi:hypothetical protein